MTTDPLIQVSNDDTGDAADLLRYYRDGMDTYRQSSIEWENKAAALARRLEAAETALRDGDALLEQALSELKPGTKAWVEMTFARREELWLDFVAAARKHRRLIRAYFAAHPAATEPTPEKEQR